MRGLCYHGEKLTDERICTMCNDVSVLLLVKSAVRDPNFRKGLSDDVNEIINIMGQIPDILKKE